MSLSEAATLSAFLRGVLKGAEECLGFLSYIHTTFIFHFWSTVTAAPVCFRGWTVFFFAHLKENRRKVKHLKGWLVFITTVQGGVLLLCANLIEKMRWELVLTTGHASGSAYLMNLWLYKLTKPVSKFTFYFPTLYREVVPSMTVVIDVVSYVIIKIHVINFLL